MSVCVCKYRVGMLLLDPYYLKYELLFEKRIWFIKYYITQVIFFYLLSSKVFPL